MILFPSGANLKETEKLIKYVAAELDRKNISDLGRNYSRDVIDRLIAGYEHQSGKEYDRSRLDVLGLW